MVLLKSIGASGSACVIEWKSRKLQRVVSSSTTAEALAANVAMNAMVYIKAVLVEVLGVQMNDVPLVLMADSRNWHRLVMSSSLVEDPRLRSKSLISVNPCIFGPPKGENTGFET